MRRNGARARANGAAPGSWPPRRARRAPGAGAAGAARLEGALPPQPRPALREGALPPRPRPARPEGALPPQLRPALLNRRAAPPQRLHGCPDAQ